MDQVARLKERLSGLEPGEFEKRLARLRGPDFGKVVADEEYISYVKAQIRKDLGYPEPQGFAPRYAVPILLAVIAMLGVLVWATAR